MRERFEDNVEPGTLGTSRIGFFVSGRGALARLAVEREAELGFATTGVVLDTTASHEFEDWLRHKSVPTLRLSSARRQTWAPEVGDFLDSLGDSYWMMTFSRIVPASLIGPRRGKLLNVHEAILPAFRGLEPLAQAVESGVKITGATIHEVTEDVDAGPILAQCTAPVLPTDGPTEVAARLFASLRLMYLQAVNWLAEGRVLREPSGRLVVRGATYESSDFSPAIEPRIFQCLIRE